MSLCHFQKLLRDAIFCVQIAFQVLVKALISLDPGKEMEFLKKQFQEFILGLMSYLFTFLEVNFIDPYRQDSWLIYMHFSKIDLINLKKKI